MALKNGNRKNAGNPINKLAKSRKETHHRQTREEIDSKLKEIQVKAEKSHDPIHPSRPYGLAEGMKGHRVHVWDLIFTHVNDPDTVASLREVCFMFKDLLERKYVAVRLPEVIEQCLERKIIPWEYSRTERSDWVKTLQNLRTLSSATKNSVDHKFDRGLLRCKGRRNWFVFNCHFDRHNYYTEEWKIQTLVLGALVQEGRRLLRIVDSLVESSESCMNSFSMRALVFDETRPNLQPLPLDLELLESLRNVFQSWLKIFGWKITSFRYKTNLDYVDTYKNLKKWLVHLPNLEELMVDFTGRRRKFYGENVGPFPKCKNLKCFAEGLEGFGYPFINKILKANPTIEEILLGRMPTTEFEISNLNYALSPLRITKFHCTSPLTLPFFKHSFQWMPTLTTFCFVDKRNLSSAPQEPIPSDKMFQSISKCKNLEYLAFFSPCIRDTGGYLNLPKLEVVCLAFLPNFTSLEFLKPVEDLKWLCLDLVRCPDLHSKKKMMQWLRKYHIPPLFPALKGVIAVTDMRVGYQTVWKS